MKRLIDKYPHLNHILDSKITSAKFNKVKPSKNNE